VSLVPGIKRNLGNRLAGEAQAVCGALEPKPPDMFFHRLADHPTEYPVKMERREARDSGQFFK
jgi:hypothetical protein